MRKTLSTLVVALTIVAILAACAAPATSTTSKAPKKVVFVHSDQMRVNYPWLYLPKLLGFWDQEGLNVQFVYMGSSYEAIKQVAAGNADASQSAADAVIEANTEGTAARQIGLTGTYTWELGVLDDSPVKALADLKGTNIGVYSVSSNSTPFLLSYLQDNGLNPDKDVSLVSVGYGAAAIEALKKGQVAAEFYWPAAFVDYSHQGLKFRFFRAPQWSHYPDYGVATLQSTIDSDPTMIEGLMRGMAKGLVFANANPQCTVKIFWAKWPEGKPTGADDATLFQWDLDNLTSQMAEVKSAYDLYGSKNWLEARTPEYSALQDFLFTKNLIKSKVDPSTLVISTPGFFDKVNAFDHAAVEAQAKNCPVQ